MAAHEDRSCDPDVRFKLLSSLADSVAVDKNIPPRRYFRSGVEMDRMVRKIFYFLDMEEAFRLSRYGRSFEYEDSWNCSCLVHLKQESTYL